MTILITGASGFIGSNVFKHLQNNYDAVGISKTSNHPNILAANLSSIEECKKALQQANIKTVDVIIHLASVLANADNLNDVNVLNQNNSMSYNVVELAKLLKATKLINFSSSSVYPNIDGEFSEDSIINPSLNADALYGLSKFNSEIIINTLTKGTTIKVSHLRPVMVYGSGVNPNRIWPVMEKELKEKNTITVFGNGKRLINQINITSLLNSIEQFINKDLLGVFNISEETVSLTDLAKRTIAKYGNNESKIIYIEQGNTSQFIVNTNKYKSIL